jgi:hypothetical protein
MFLRLLSMRKSLNVKRVVLAFLLVAFLLLLPQIGLAQTTLDSDSLGLTGSANGESASEIGLGQSSVKTVITTVVRVILGFLGIILVILILYGGFIWMTAAGDPGKVDKAKKILTNAVIGVIIVLASYGIANFIISRFLGTGGGTSTGSSSRGGSGDFGRIGIGGGAIRSVYPSSGQHGVPINTKIAVTFKEEIDPQSICGEDACTNSQMSDNITICMADDCESQDPTDFSSDKYTGISGTRVTSIDNKTFGFRVAKYLGEDDGLTREFLVTLGEGIENVRGEPVFSSLRGNQFSWNFFTNGQLDLDPPELIDRVGVYPNPDSNEDGFQTSAQSTPAEFTINVGDINLIEFETASRFTPEELNNQIQGSSVKAQLSGNYTGDYDGLVVVEVVNADVTARWGSTQITSTYVSGATLDIGIYGLTFTIDGSVISGSHQWTFDVTPTNSGDEIEVHRNGQVIETYTIGDNVAVDSSNTVAQIKSAIRDKLVGQGLFTGCTGGRSCDVRTNTTGESANDYNITENSSGIDIPTRQDGKDQEVSRTQNGLFDPTKDTIFQISFNEPVDPVTIDEYLVVKYDTTEDGNANETLDRGKYTINYSNDFKTIGISPDYVGASPCDVNNCGKKKFCWDTAVGRSTLFEISLTAARLEYDADTCSNWNGQSDGHGRCEKIGEPNVYHPRGVTGTGIVDMSGNSFNGSFNTYDLNGKLIGLAEGQSGIDGGRSGNDSQFYINDRMMPVGARSGGVRLDTYGVSVPDYNDGNANRSADDNGGDNLKWSFYISDEIDTTPPVISSISPIGGERVEEPDKSIEVSFDRIMRSSTLRPGYNYGVVGSIDRTVRYLVLETLGNANPVGYWISKAELDNDGNGWPDYTKAYINHNDFDREVRYAPMVGSGLESITQNCFLPSVGPAGAGETDCVGGSNCSANLNPNKNAASFASMSCNEIRIDNSTTASLCASGESCVPLVDVKICETGPSIGEDCSLDEGVCGTGNECIDNPLIGGSWVITTENGVSDNHGCCFGRCQ